MYCVPTKGTYYVYLLSVLVYSSCSTNLSSISPIPFASLPFTVPCSHSSFWRKEEAELDGLVASDVVEHLGRRRYTKTGVGGL